MVKTDSGRQKSESSTKKKVRILKKKKRRENNTMKQRQSITVHVDWNGAQIRWHAVQEFEEFKNSMKNAKDRKKKN